MHLLSTAPIALLELLCFAIRGIEARANAHLLGRKAGNKTLASPVIAEPSQSWESVDGIWSTSVIRVGTPSALPEHPTLESDISAGVDTGVKSSSKDSGLSRGAIAGIVVGVLAVLFLIGLIVLFIRQRQKSRRSDVSHEVAELDSGKRIDKPGAGGKLISEQGEQTSAFTNEVEGREIERRVKLEATPSTIPIELPADKELGERSVESPTSPTGKSFEDYGGKRAGGDSIDAEEAEERTDFVKPQVTVSSPQGKERTWVPTSPVRRSGTAGSRFREAI